MTHAQGREKEDKSRGYMSNEISHGGEPRRDAERRPKVVLLPRRGNEWTPDHKSDKGKGKGKGDRGAKRQGKVSGGRFRLHHKSGGG